MSEPIRPFATVCRWSRFTGQSRPIPSARVSNTSEGMSRTVDVIGAIVTSARNSTAESRVRMTIGRLESSPFLVEIVHGSRFV